MLRVVKIRGGGRGGLEKRGEGMAKVASGMRYGEIIGGGVGKSWWGYGEKKLACGETLHPHTHMCRMQSPNLRVLQQAMTLCTALRVGTRAEERLAASNFGRWQGGRVGWLAGGIREVGWRAGWGGGLGGDGGPEGKWVRQGWRVGSRVS